MASFRRAVINVHRVLGSYALANLNPIASTSTSSFDTLLRWVSRYSSDSARSLEIDFSNEDRKRRLFNRLLYRSRQRGFLELDLVLGKWVEEHIHSVDENGIRALVDVLDLCSQVKFGVVPGLINRGKQENPDLWKWLSGQEQPPEAVISNPVFSSVRNKVMNNLNSHTSPKTRAEPAQPWVRGWNDFTKGKFTPVSGNQ